MNNFTWGFLAYWGLIIISWMEVALFMKIALKLQQLSKKIYNYDITWKLKGKI